jgi:LruC domain-containing protein
MITNAQKQVSEIHARIMTDAIGASFHSGFGFQLPFSPDKVSNVTGFVLKHGYINLSANKTESGQAKAVIIAFDDAFDQLHAPGNGYSGANTLPGEPFSIPDTLDLVITLSSPVATAQAGSPPFNPFIIIDGNRNREIHLPNQSPTDKVDGTEFGTGSDKSNPSQGIYYKTKNNLPWAMNIVEKFNYPVEKAPINSGFLKFNNWAGSSGTQYNDWYKDLVGYRQQSIIYSH